MKRTYDALCMFHCARKTFCNHDIDYSLGVSHVQNMITFFFPYNNLHVIIERAPAVLVPIFRRDYSFSSVLHACTYIHCILEQRTLFLLLAQFSNYFNIICIDYDLRGHLKMKFSSGEAETAKSRFIYGNLATP